MYLSEKGVSEHQLEEAYSVTDIPPKGSAARLEHVASLPEQAEKIEEKGSLANRTKRLKGVEKENFQLKKLVAVFSWNIAISK